MIHSFVKKRLKVIIMEFWHTIFPTDTESKVANDFYVGKTNPVIVVQRYFRIHFGFTVHKTLLSQSIQKFLKQLDAYEKMKVLSVALRIYWQYHCGGVMTPTKNILGM